jgi:hypothetical protein
MSHTENQKTEDTEYLEKEELFVKIVIVGKNPSNTFD